MVARAGLLRHKITIQQRTNANDGFGQPQPTWSTFATVFAAVEPINGREYFSANEYKTEVTVRIRIRYISGMSTKMRISWNGNIYNIESIIDVSERTKMLQLMCSEGVNDG